MHEDLVFIYVRVEQKDGKMSENCSQDCFYEGSKREAQGTYICFRQSGDFLDLVKYVHVN